MAECGGRSRVGEVVGWYIYGLHTGDAAFLGAGDAFLHDSHLAGKRGLVADGTGHAPQQGAHLTARLCETEDVVDKQQYVAAFTFGSVVTETLGYGKTA